MMGLDERAGIGSPKVTSRTFDAPLGVCFIKTSGSDSCTPIQTGGPEVALTLSPGNYKGVHSDPIYRYTMAGATAKSIR